MSREESTTPVVRFLATLEVVCREGTHLDYSRNRLFALAVDNEWVACLESRPEEAERLEAFVSRFGRMQDTISDKLLPRWLLALAERPGSLIDTLNRAERLGVIENALQWVAMRQLRNKLVHEYLGDPAEFAESLLLARDFVDVLNATYNRLRNYAEEQMKIDAARLPSRLPLGGMQ